MNRPLQKFWLNFLKRQIPVSNEVRLHQRNIFILPSSFGFFFALLNVLLFVLGVNYQNNLVIILSSFCFSLFITTMLLCYQNIAGLVIRPIARQEYTANELLAVECDLTTAGVKHGVKLHYKHEPEIIVSSIDGQKNIALTLNKRCRGTHRLPRLLLSSQYPLGLFKAWSNLEFEQDIVVFPAPLSYMEQLTAMEESQGKNLSRHTRSGDSFSGLESYREGESLKRVAWKQMAQGKGMLTKQFEQTMGEPQWLDINEIEGNDLEDKISHLAYLVNYFSSNSQPYGLKLNQYTLAVATGNAHRHEALTLLANYGKPLFMESNDG